MRHLVAIVLTGCTTLGPMPTTTGMSAVPAQRPGAEAQLGIVPAYFLSSSVQKPHGAATTQLELVFEPDRWFNAPGLVLGGRLFGQADDTPGEPLLGYRAKLSDDLSIAGVVYGTSKRSTQRLASYHATRVGGELAVDANTIALATWLAMHVQAAFSATRVSASGTYCVDATGLGKDCDQMDQSKNTFIDGHVSGVYPSGTGSVTLDIGRRGSGILHGARIALMGSTGWMPTAASGVQGDAQAFFSLGLSLTLGLGKSD